MVNIIDHPSYVLEDQIVSCPEVCSVGAFLLERYADECKVPPPIVDKFTGWTSSHDEFEVWTAMEHTPKQVTKDVTPLWPRALYHKGQPNGLPENMQGRVARY